MEPSQDASVRWRRVCEISLRVMDAPKGEWDAILDRECDSELRAQVLAVCRDYSETDDFLGAVGVSPLLFEDLLTG